MMKIYQVLLLIHGFCHGFRIADVSKLNFRVTSYRPLWLQSFPRSKELIYTWEMNWQVVFYLSLILVVAHVKAPRMTMFGSTCLEQWTYNTKMYTRCTTDPDPNGMQGQEWCMIDVTGMPTNSDLKNWDKCDNKLDTDSLRSGIVTNQRTEITTTTFLNLISLILDL